MYEYSIAVKLFIIVYHFRPYASFLVDNAGNFELITMQKRETDASQALVELYVDGVGSNFKLGLGVINIEKFHMFH